MRELMRGNIEQRRQARKYDDYLRRKVEAGRASMHADRKRGGEIVSDPVSWPRFSLAGLINKSDNQTS